MRNRTTILPAALAFPLCLLAGSLAALVLTAAPARAQAPYAMSGSVVSGGGVMGQSASYAAGGTLGQPTPVGTGAAAGTTLLAGFWGTYRIPTGTEAPPVPYRTMLHQNFPNPFNPTTSIEYSLARAGQVEIAIFDVNGRRIATLVDAPRAPGQYRAVWDGTSERGRRVASGIYFCRLATDSGAMIRKMILLR